jgi:hypothetical protein
MGEYSGVSEFIMRRSENTVLYKSLPIDVSHGGDCDKSPAP